MTRTIDFAAAACRDEQPDVFFDADRADEALAICDRCSQQAACIANNLTERGGVFGCSERARRRAKVALRVNPDISDEELIAIARRTSRSRGRLPHSILELADD